MFMIKIRNCLRFPTPKETGLSKYNALPMRSLTPDTKGFSWEDYYQYLELKYPIRYFLYKKVIESIYYFILFNFVKPIKNAYWWVRHNTINRYHKLDLTQPKSETADDYTSGYRDPCDRMTFAMFNLLTEYVKSRNLLENNDELDPNETEKFIIDDFNRKAEAVFLYHWWHETRKSDLKYYDKVLNDWIELRNKEYKTVEKRKLFEYSIELEEKLNNDLDEMLIRLAKLRKSMW